MVSISEGNTKMGKIASVSMTLIKACGNCSKCAADCYAKKAYRQYKQTRAAWDNNFNEATYNRQEYFQDVESYLLKKKPANFRWHVAGDILDYSYFISMVRIAKEFPKTNFLCFTKMHDLIEQWFDIDKKRKIPNNLKIFLSIWIDEEIDNKYKLSTARVVRKGETGKYDGFICKGSCATCMVCFEGLTGSKVIFEKH